MPTKRSRLSRGRILSGGLSQADFIFFTWGPFFEAENYAEGKTDEELKGFWLRHRDAIMERYLERNRKQGRKGCRCWSFWRWDIVEPRLPADMRLASNELYDLKKVRPGDGLEADFAYLRRLKLLEDWEKD